MKNDPRSCECNLCNCVRSLKKNSGLFSCFFSGFSRNCINCVHNCEDHIFFIWFHFRSSHIWFISYTFVTVHTLAGFLKTPNSWNGPVFCVQQFFSAKNYLKVAIIECNHCFFLFFSFLPPRSLFLSFAFPSLVWFWSLWGSRNLSFDSNDCKFR